MLMVAMVGSAIFVISCMPMPVPVDRYSCSHPCGTGLGALLIGPGPTVVVASIALLLQALFLCARRPDDPGSQHHVDGRRRAHSAHIGSFICCGAMRLPLLPAAFAGRHAFRLGHLRHDLAGIGQRAAPRRLDVGDVRRYRRGFLPTQVPLGIIEGVVTALAYRFVSGPPSRAARRRPLGQPQWERSMKSVLRRSAASDRGFACCSAARHGPRGDCGERLEGGRRHDDREDWPPRPAIRPASPLSTSTRATCSLLHVPAWPGPWAASSPDTPSAACFRPQGRRRERPTMHRILEPFASDRTPATVRWRGSTSASS